jgi:hypothetical protein
MEEMLSKFGEAVDQVVWKLSDRAFFDTIAGSREP